ncbi:MAG: methionine--tRNA ligase subunit beta, partial [Muribaculaceae bacterium]|nr:methionine--tRNA ligase subunit beta [Muribaculaceae bacterium]
YVWFDAPIGYISNTIEALGDDWERWWKDPETRMLHFIGKDNIVFHCIVFPSMLMADGSYNLPDNVPANEFLNLENDKISTSRNWAVWLHEYLEELPGKQDTLRYVLTANAPETKDNNFTWKDFQARNNSELVAILGNFINRAVVLTHKYFDGKVPPVSTLEVVDTQLIEEIGKLKGEMTEALDTFHFREALKLAMDMARAGNKYLQETEPWKVAKTDMERTGTILNIALQTCANLAIAFEPFLPFMAEKLLKMLGMEKISWDMLATFDLVPTGAKIGEPELLFEKIEDSVVEAQVKKLNDAKEKNRLAEWKPAEVKPNVDFETFEKIDIRVGKVLECTKVKKSKKLLQFLIDDGMEKRTILSGIAESYPDPAVLVGKEVCFVANFAPRKMMGIESQGMIMSAVNPDGKLTVISPSAEVVPGASVG